MSHADAFKVNTADFALFAGFYVLAQAIERFIEPFTRVIPPWGGTPRAKADRSLYTLSAAIVVGVVLSAAFGMYFLEAIGVKIGHEVTLAGGAKTLQVTTDGDKLLRGLDIYVTALLIAGGTKSLHELIGWVQKSKESIPAPAATP